MSRDNGKSLNMIGKGLTCLALTAAASIAQLGHAQTAANTTFKIGGYIKLDAISSEYKDGDLVGNNIGRDFYVPGLLPVGKQGESRDLDFHARSSRFNIKSVTDIEGQQLVGFFELDFLAGTEGDERVSNSYQPRLRHAYFSYGKWLFGQTWTTFQNVSVLPETADFIGPSEGTVFGRQAQIRYTKDNWQFSLENPESTVTLNNTATRVATDDGGLPDMVARYNFTTERGTWSVAGIARSLTYEDALSGIDDSTIGYGVSVAGLIKIGARNDLRFMVTGGSGLGRYVGLNLVNGAAVGADGSLESIDLMAGMVSYRHFWTEKTRSTVSLGAFSANHDMNLVDAGVTESARSLRFNLFHSPVKSVTFGGELMLAERSLENGLTGDMNRLQFSARPVFSPKNGSVMMLSTKGGLRALALNWRCIGPESKQHVEMNPRRCSG